MKMQSQYGVTICNIKSLRLSYSALPRLDLYSLHVNFFPFIFNISATFKCNNTCLQ